MKVKEFFSETVAVLSKIYESGEAEQLTAMILEKFSGRNTRNLWRSSDEELTSDEETELNTARHRLLQREPVQYITGEAWFYHLRFVVTPDVLIPRPETEELVEEMVKYAGTLAGELLDVGTGSGCIPIAFINQAKTWNATGIDISEYALTVARKNSEMLEIPVQFLGMDFLNRENWQQLKKYDIISSNPPYIPNIEKNTIAPEVINYEPHLALFVPRAMVFYEAIAEMGKEHLKPSGKIFMETHQNFAQDVAKLFNEAGYTTEVKKDISGNERMVIASLFPKQ